MERIIRLCLIRSLIIYSFTAYAQEPVSPEYVAAYRTYNQILTQLQQIENDHPEICKLYDIGDTWGKMYAEAGNTSYNAYNQEIWALKVSDNVSKEEDEPSLFFMGGIHANEPAGVEVVMAVLNHIVSQYDNDPSVTEKVHASQIWFVPLVNPNGYTVAMDGSDIGWVKNIRDNNNNGILDNEDGVNINRNFGYSWGEVGASGIWMDETYHGPGACSEPEVQAH